MWVGKKQGKKIEKFCEGEGALARLSYRIYMLVMGEKVSVLYGCAMS